MDDPAVNSTPAATASVEAYQPPAVTLPDGREVIVREVPFQAAEILIERFGTELAPAVLGIANLFKDQQAADAEGNPLYLEDGNPLIVNIADLSAERQAEIFLGAAQSYASQLGRIPGLIRTLVAESIPELDDEAVRRLRTGVVLRLATACIFALIIDLGGVRDFFDAVKSAAAHVSPPAPTSAPQSKGTGA